MTSAALRPSMITTPGIYEIEAESYHRDPCPEPSLSSSIAGALIGKTPRHAWVRHPRLNPNWQPDESDARMDFGSVAHRILLGRGSVIVAVNADDWRTKAAREARDAARVEGKVAVLERQLQQADEMAGAALQQLKLIDDCQDAFRGKGRAEAVLAWQERTIDGADPIWCRAMLDWLPERRDTGHVIIYDYKTTERDLTPYTVGAHLFSCGYDVPAAFYERGIEALMDEAAGRVVMRFVVQEKEPPYLLQVAELDNAGLIIGRKKVAYAIDMWRRCLSLSTWPGFPTRIIRAEMPPWIESRWLERELASDAGDNDPFLIGSRWIPDVHRPLINLGEAG